MYHTEELEHIQKKLSKKLKPSRYQHSISVMYTAAALAMAHEVNLDQAMIAGLLHDCGKYPDIHEQIKACEKHGVHLTEQDQYYPALIHTKLGVALAKDQYGIEDHAILDAIAYHTTGRPGMTTLEEILYLADFIEPLRGNSEWFEKVRKIAFTNLQEAVYLCAKLTLDYLHDKEKEIEPLSEQTLAFYETLLGK